MENFINSLGELLLFLMLMFGVIILIILILEICRSTAVYVLAKRRGILNPWLAWVPFARWWIMGSLVDQYTYLVKGRNTSLRYWAFGLSFANTFFGKFQYSNITRPLLSGFSFESITAANHVFTFVLFIGIVLMLGAAFVMKLVVVYGIYRSCVPGMAVLFLILSLLIPFLAPMFLLYCMHKDGGMPPRRDEARPSNENDTRNERYNPVEDRWE